MTEDHILRVVLYDLVKYSVLWAGDGDNLLENPRKTVAKKRAPGIDKRKKFSCIRFRGRFRLSIQGSKLERVQS